MNLKTIKQSLTKIINNININPKDDCASVLGSDYKLGEIAKIWDGNAGDFHMIAAHVILDKISKEGIDSDAFDNYKEGIKDFLDFVDKCNKEYYLKIR